MKTKNIRIPITYRGSVRALSVRIRAFHSPARSAKSSVITNKATSSSGVISFKS